MRKQRYKSRSSYSPQLIGVVLGGLCGVFLAYVVLLHVFNYDAAPLVTDFFRDLDSVLNPKKG